LWLGITRSKKNHEKWESYNGPLIYTNWDEKEPDNRDNAGEDCGVMLTDSGKWHDFVCWKDIKATKVLCEKTIDRPKKASYS
jgi:hypothetical protein